MRLITLSTSSLLATLLLMMVSVVPVYPQAGSDAAASDASSPENSAALDIQVVDLNGVYEKLPVPMEPIEQGPMTILLRSPDNELTVHEHRVRLTATDQPGVVEADFEANVEGWGDLDIDLDYGVSQSRFDDRVVAGRQWLRMQGTVRLDILPTQYQVTFLGYAHQSVGILIESNVGSQMIDTCRALLSFGLGAFDCDGLSRAFSRVEIPLPEIGSSYFLPFELFSEADQQRIENLVSSSGS